MAEKTQFKGTPLGEYLSTLTKEDWKKAHAFETISKKEREKIEKIKRERQ